MVCELAVLSIRAANDGTVWVLSSSGTAGLPVGVIMAWDVFSEAGEYLHRVGVAGRGDPREDSFFFTGDRTVLQIVFGEDTGEMAIVHHELREEGL